MPGHYLTKEQRQFIGNFFNNETEQIASDTKRVAATTKAFFETFGRKVSIDTVHWYKKASLTEPIEEDKNDKMSGHHYTEEQCQFVIKFYNKETDQNASDRKRVMETAAACSDKFGREISYATVCRFIDTSLHEPTEKNEDGYATGRLYTKEQREFVIDYYNKDSDENINKNKRAKAIAEAFFEKFGRLIPLKSIHQLAKRALAEQIRRSKEDKMRNRVLIDNDCTEVLAPNYDASAEEQFIVYVYIINIDGVFKYVGQTCDCLRRAMAHASDMFRGTDFVMTAVIACKVSVLSTNCMLILILHIFCF